MADVDARVRNLSATPAEWAANDLVLLTGEIAFEVDVNVWRGKVGDGVRTFSQIPYTISVEAVVQNMAELRLLGCADLVYMKGYYTPGDSGGGHFYFDNASSEADNGGTIILPTGETGAGRWIRIIEDSINVLMFGAVGNDFTDDTSAIQAAVDYATSAGGMDIKFGAGAFIVSQTIDLPNATGVKLVGQGGGYNYGDGVLNSATSIIWSGLAGVFTPVIHFRTTQNAPRKSTSGGINGIQIDCNSLAGIGIQMTSVNSFEVDDVNISESTTTGLLCACLDDSLANGDSAETQNNWFDRLSVKTETGACIRLQSNGGLLATVGANTSQNRFGQIALNIRNNDGFVFGGSNSNFVEMLKLYMPFDRTGRGVVFEADNGGNNNFASQNVLAFVETAFSEVYALAGNGTQPSMDNAIFNLSLGNGGLNNLPVIETGAGFSYGTPRGGTLKGFDRSAFVNSNAATFSQVKMREQVDLITTETMRIYSGLQRHQLFSTNSGDMWEIKVLSGVNGDFTISRISGTGSIGLTAPLILSNQTVGSTAPAAGAAGAVPTNPTGWVSINVNGVAAKMPYWAA